MSHSRTRFANSTKARAVTADDYAIHVATTNVALQRFIGKLTVVRKTDGRKLYPFEGAPFIGPFNSIQKAKEAALALGASVVLGDLKTPEP